MRTMWVKLVVYIIIFAMLITTLATGAMLF